MRIFYLASELNFATENTFSVRGKSVLRALENMATEIKTCYRVGHPGDKVDTAGNRGRLFGKLPVVVSPNDFWAFRPDAVVFEGGLTQRAIRSDESVSWRDSSWRLPAVIALDYLHQGGVIVALDVGYDAGHGANARRVFGSSEFRRAFGAVVPVSLENDADPNLRLRELIDWTTQQKLIQFASGEIQIAKGMEDVLQDVSEVAINNAIQLLPAGEALMAAKATVGILCDDRAPATRPDAWTRLTLATYHRQGQGWSALIAGDVTCEDKAFQATDNPRFLAQLVRHLVDDAKGQSLDGHQHNRASHDLPDTRFAGTRVLVLTVTETEREAVISVLPSPASWDAPFPVAGFTTRHLTAAGVEFFHAPVAKGVRATAFIQQAITAVQPRFVVMVGICAGLGEHGDSEQHRGGSVQKLGDVVIADTVHDLAQGKIVPGLKDGRTVDFIERADYKTVFPCDPYLLDVFRDAARAINGCTECTQRQAVHFGTVLASPYVIKSTTMREWIRARYPAAVALEMEGGMLGLTASGEFADFLLVKGISDWADDKMEQSKPEQPMAAANAIALVLHVFTHS